ncbi:MAG TPA: glycosyltransferase family 9 protein [Vicinamibacteria bacterium]
MRALVVRLSAIGDVVHALPAATALHARGWTVDWLVEPPARPLLEGHAALARVVTAPPARRFRAGAARAALRALRQQPRDVALDLQGLWKSAAWARLSGARRALGYAAPWRREGASARLLHERVPPAAGVAHVIDEHLALLRPLGIEAVGTRDFGLPRGVAEAAAVERGLLELKLDDFVVLNPGGGWPEKLWPPERFGELARGLRERRLACVVTWGPGERPRAERVVEAAGGAATLCFPTTLLELLELLRRAHLLVAADTGPLHLACAASVPVVGLFGPTDPARNGPFSPADEVVEAPHGGAGRVRYRREGARMGEIPVQSVLAAVDRRLAPRGDAA